jgi:squalene-hopene/tetraprenyl-beta-curcumene cyclase
MTIQVDLEQLAAAHSIARRQLLAQRHSGAHWKGELASSPLCTATAISALVLAERHVDDTPTEDLGMEHSWLSGVLIRSELNELVAKSLRWLAEHQNADGGWGDTDRSRSNIAATLLVEAAFNLTGVPVKYSDVLQRAKHYVDSQGGLAALKKRFAHDRQFAAAILTNCALAGMVPWKKVPSLPFEWACLPRKWQRMMGLNSASYTLPTLVAVGQTKFHYQQHRNPFVRWMRRWAVKPSLAALSTAQTPDGGFSETTALTSFVLMCLASMGHCEHPIVRRGTEFLLSTVRSDGSWAPCPDFAVSDTARSLRSLQWNLSDEFQSASWSTAPEPSEQASEALTWILGAQHQLVHPHTGAAPGAWGWSPSPGAIPNASDTANVLLILADWHRQWPRHRTSEVTGAAAKATRWLLDMQNRDGGWAIFCPGWTGSPSDSSCSDVTALAMRALNNWVKHLRQTAPSHPLIRRIDAGLKRGLDFLKENQREEGSWWPRWFGNELHPQEANPVIGTSQVLKTLSDMQAGNTDMAQKAVNWLSGVQFPAGGWGAVGEKPSLDSWYARKRDTESEACCSIEETAVAIDALLPFAVDSQAVKKCVEHGLSWLIDASADSSRLEPALVGFYLTKLWYYDELLPQTLAVRTLGNACRAIGVPATVATVGHP